MLQTGIFNPHLLSLLARVRHTNTLVIADVGFPYWPNVETVDLSLTADIPSVPDVLRALQSNFKHGHVWMAAEFLEHNALPVHARFQSLVSVPIGYEPHIVQAPRSAGDWPDSHGGHHTVRQHHSGVGLRSAARRVAEVAGRCVAGSCISA